MIILSADDIEIAAVGVLCCPGTAIVHVDGQFECSDDPNCDVPQIAHDYLVRCEDESCCAN